MPVTRFVYRGCAVEIEIVDKGCRWLIRISIVPFDGVELIEAFGNRELKLAKDEPLDVIQEALVEEIRSAIDHRLVGC